MGRLANIKGENCKIYSLVCRLLFLGKWGKIRSELRNEQNEIF